MSQNPQGFVRKYEELLAKNPKSQVFAPLAEAYRKQGDVDRAIKICQKGLEKNEGFASGHLALARCYIVKKSFHLAKDQLQIAVSSSPENLLAQQLLGDLCLKLQQPKEALAAFKMVLYINPHHEKAQKAVKKLESLTADEYGDEIFSMKKLSSLSPSVSGLSDDEELFIESGEEPETQSSDNDLLDRYLSLVDAFVARGDHERAHAAMLEAEKQLGDLPELKKRRQYVLINRTLDRYSDLPSEPEVQTMPQTKDEIEILEPIARPIPSFPGAEKKASREIVKKKIHFLESLLKSLPPNS